MQQNDLWRLEGSLCDIKHVCISTYDSVPSQYNIKERTARRDVFEKALEYEMLIIYILKADFD